MNKVKGFTLVELSIVLVIIGLLVGGILVAQSMISTAKDTAFIKQLNQFDIALANFQTLYNGLPGDTVGLGCIDEGNKCGDDMIEDENGSNNTFGGEIGAYWSDLSTSGLLNPHGQAYSNARAGANYNPGINIPISVLGLPNTIWMVWGLSNGQNWYQIEQFTDGYPSVTSATESIPWSDALAVDTKVDDGNINTGKIFSGCTSNDAAGMCSVFIEPGTSVMGQSANN